jgi:hypothetical protein
MDGTYCGTTYYRCEICHHLGEKNEFPEITVFHRITASPEVLAEKLVYKTAIRTSKTVYDHWGDGVGVSYDIKEVWKSTITEDTYISETEAIAATVEKLKEVEK